jgi:hypothetical protein
MSTLISKGLMSDKKTQIGFRVTEKFYERIKAESIARDLSIQDLIVASMKFYFSTPEQWDYVTAQFITSDDSGEARKASVERVEWMRVWERYMSDMPRVKTVHLAEIMQLDLRHYGSSRRKRNVSRAIRAKKKRGA